MVAKYPRHIALTKPLAGYVDDKVACGEYASASEVVRTALRLLIERDAVQHVDAGGIAHKARSTGRSR
ncbi:MAG: type II toxin-antitoxin system ParD family antitoxin [Janthinobacterium lividum]